MSLGEVIRDWCSRVRVKPDTMEPIWPFQLMEFAACEIRTQTAKLEGWFGKSGAALSGGEMECDNNYLVSCALICQAVSKIQDEQWELSQKAMIYTTYAHLKKLLDRNEVFMENVTRDTSELNPFSQIIIHVDDIQTRFEHIGMWFRHSDAELWDRGAKNFQTSLDVIEAAVDVIMEEIKILEKYWLKYQQLSDDQVICEQ